MMDARLKRFAIAGALAVLPAAGIAQQPKPAEQKEAEAPAARISRNVSLEITITDQSSASESSKKVVSMIVADGRRGSVRSSGSSRTPTEGRTVVTLNVDARTIVMTSGTILTELTLEYIPKPDPNDEAKDAPRSQLNQSLALLLESGKPTIVSQAADPVSNRKITVEVRATVLK